jgi:hypothetical protein
LLWQSDGEETIRSPPLLLFTHAWIVPGVLLDTA